MSVSSEIKASLEGLQGQITTLGEQITSRLAGLEVRLGAVEGEVATVADRIGLTFERKVYKQLDQVAALMQEENFAPIFPILVGIFTEQFEGHHANTPELDKRIWQLSHQIIQSKDQAVTAGRYALADFFVRNRCILSAKGWLPENEPLKTAGPNEWERLSKEYLKARKKTKAS